MYRGNDRRLCCHRLESSERNIKKEIVNLMFLFFLGAKSFFLPDQPM